MRCHILLVIQRLVLVNAETGSIMKVRDNTTLLCDLLLLSQHLVVLFLEVNSCISSGDGHASYAVVGLTLGFNYYLIQLHPAVV